MTGYAPQGSGAWLNARVGHLTASRMADAMAVLKSGKASEARNKLMIELCAERDPQPGAVPERPLVALDQAL